MLCETTRHGWLNMTVLGTTPIIPKALDETKAILCINQPIGRTAAMQNLSPAGPDHGCICVSVAIIFTVIGAVRSRRSSVRAAGEVQGMPVEVRLRSDCVG
ncbi:uncharacterized protein PgNI_08048 [Pyricularia grisea]|uniref:Uncharacterized protein n=1 Tax=Pyricularia grisea TaxID=148305 RepID=A0A6P8AWH1_PYRGI|nr:uncharacterized protein PgNI_08048 [Pyricularia grisea]TLD06537.1 hypothetical protein PgNI_08048 [Pyricularia grisea]